MLFTCKNFMFSNFTWEEEMMVPGKGGGGRCPFSMALIVYIIYIPTIKYRIKWAYDIYFHFLLLYQNICKSGLSERRPNCLWLPKYSSISSWQNLSVRTNSTPDNKNFVTLTIAFVVILNPSKVCEDINILLWAFSEKLLPRFSIIHHLC